MKIKNTNTQNLKCCRANNRGHYKIKKIFTVLFLLITVISFGTTYYNKASGYCNNLTDWGTAANGTGAAPANFTTSGDIFNVSNGTMYQSATWTVGTGVTVNVNSGANLESYNYTMDLSLATLNVNNGGTFLKDGTGTLTLPTTVANATFASGSTMNFTRGSNQFDPKYNYGNLTFNDPFDGPPTMGTTYGLRVQSDLNLLDVRNTFVLSTTASLTHTISGNLNINIASGSEYFYMSNGSGSPTINIGGNLNYTGTGQCIVNNSTGGATLNVTGTSTFNNSFGAFVVSKNTGSSTMTLTGNVTITTGTVELCDNTGNATVTMAGTVTQNGGEFDVKGNTASTNAISPTLTINGLYTLTLGTFMGNRNRGGTPTVNLSGGLTQSGGQFTGSSNTGSATVNIGTSAVPKDINQTGGTVHISNDVDNAGATIGNVIFNIYGSIILNATGHFDLSYEAVGGNNTINVGGSATAPSGAVFGGPHCWNRNNCTATLVMKSPFTAGWAVATATGNLSMTTGDYDAALLCTGSNSRQGIGQFNVIIEAGKTITLNSDIEPGDNRTFDVYGTLITYNGATQYKTARRYATYDNPVLGVPQPIAGAYSTLCWTYIRSAATIDAGDVNGLTIEGTYAGSVQTDKRHYNSGGNYKFTQSAAQVTGNFITATTPTLNDVNSIIVNNSNTTVTTGLTLSNQVLITTTLQFLQGRFKTTSTNFPTIDVAGTASGFSTTNGTTAGTASFVDGPIRKIMNSTSTFIFPTGKSSGTALYRPLAITPGSTATDTYESELINTAPTASGFTSTSLLPPLTWNNNAYFWWLTSGTGSVSNLVRAYYTDGDLSPSSKPFDSYAVVTEWNVSPTQWESLGESVVDSSAGSGGTFLHYIDAGVGVFVPTGITNRVRPFDIGTESTIILPIELLDISATPMNNTVHVKWSTASEKNNNYFTLERSADGVNFAPLTRIKGAGNSTMTNNYSYVDMHPFNGFNYYRLKQNDYNGQASCSKLVAALIEKRNTGLLFPNPAVETIFIPLQSEEENSTLQVFTLEGTLYYSADVIPSQGDVMKVDVKNFSPGIYFVNIVAASGKQLNYKFVKK